MHRVLMLAFSSLAVATLLLGQTPHRLAIRAGRLIDTKNDKVVENAVDELTELVWRPGRSEIVVAIEASRMRRHRRR